MGDDRIRGGDELPVRRQRDPRGRRLLWRQRRRGGVQLESLGRRLLSRGDRDRQPDRHRGGHRPAGEDLHRPRDGAHRDPCHPRRKRGDRQWRLRRRAGARSTRRGATPGRGVRHRGGRVHPHRLLGALPRRLRGRRQLALVGGRALNPASISGSRPDHVRSSTLHSVRWNRRAPDEARPEPHPTGDPFEHSTMHPPRTPASTGSGRRPGSPPRHRCRGR